MTKILCCIWFDCDKNFSSNYFKWILNSISRNSGLDFIIFTNDQTKFITDNKINLKIIQYNRDQVIQKINEKFKSNISLDIKNYDFGRNYVCGLKPYTYSIFDEYIPKNYTHIGWMDYDVSLDTGIDKTLNNILKDKNISYCARHAWCSQFSIMSLDLCEYIQNNLDCPIKWFNINKRFRYYDEQYSVDKPIENKHFGLIYLIKSFSNKYNKNIYRFLENDDIEMIGGGHVCKPLFDFSIQYENYELNKNSIKLMIENNESENYINRIKNKSIIWSLDCHFKLGLLNNPLLFKNYKEKHNI